MLVVLGCGDYTIPLIDGYYISRLSSGRFAVVSPDQRIVIKPTIIGYGTDQGLIYGVFESESTGGGTEYFIIETKTGAVETLSDRAQWETALARRGVARPELATPSRRDAATSGTRLNSNG